MDKFNTASDYIKNLKRPRHKPAHPKYHRSDEIAKIKLRLEQDSLPRFQMLFLVVLAGTVGFFISYALLHSGFYEMWFRYLISISVAYLVFLFLLWLWLKTRADDFSPDPISNYDISNPSTTLNHQTYNGDGGSFDGGGASSSFDTPLSSDVSSMDGSGVGDAVGELAIPLFMLMVVVTIAFSSLYIVYSAPTLFAELVVDGILSASLYRRLRGLKAQHWLKTALQRTIWPFIITAIFICTSGWLMARHNPQAHSIGDVILSQAQK